MKGIILSGGLGSRLGPLTLTVSKQLLPVYDKPMIYYPLATLMMLNITDILVISSSEHISFFEDLLGNGFSIGINLHYKVQEIPSGIAEAFTIGEEFIGDDTVCLILGDNIFYGQEFISQLLKKTSNLRGSLITAYQVNNPKEFGVVTFDSNFRVLTLEEKPNKPNSNFAVPGLYFYDNSVIEIAKNLRPSSRGELEITDINKIYLDRNELQVHPLGRGVAWLDTGSPESLLSASEFVEVIQKRQGLYVACLEEIAWRKGYISLDELSRLGENMKNSDYGKYLLRLVDYEITKLL